MGSRFGSERGGAAEMQASQSPRWLDTAARAPPRPSLDDRRAGREERQGEAQCRSRRGNTQSATQPAKGGPRRRRYDIPSSGSSSEVKEDLRVGRYGLLSPNTSLASSQGAPCDSPVAQSAGPREGRVPRVPKRLGPRVPKRQGPRVPKRQQPEQAGQLGDEGEQLGPLPLRPPAAIYSPDRVGIPQSSQHGEAWVGSRGQGAEQLRQLVGERGLVDPWRHLHPSKRDLTHFSERWQTGARLDRWYISEEVVQWQMDSAIQGLPTDHRPGLARRAQQFLRVQRRAQRDLRQRREKAAAAARAHLVRQLMRVEREGEAEVGSAAATTAEPYIPGPSPCLSWHLGLLVKALTKGAVLASEGKLAANKLAANKLRASTAKGLAAAGQWVGAEPSASPSSLDPVDAEVAGPTAPWPRQDTGVGSVHLLPVQETVSSSGIGSRFGSERGGAAEMQASQSPRWLDTAARAPPRPSLDDRRAGREERQGEAQCRSRRGSTQSATQPAKGGPRRRRYDIPSSGSISEVKEDLRVGRYGLLSPNTSPSSSQGAPCDSPVAESAGPREGRVPRVPKRQGPRVPKRQGPRVPKRQQPEQAGQLGDEGEQLGPLPLRPPAAIYSRALRPTHPPPHTRSPREDEPGLAMQRPRVAAKFMAVTLNVQGLAQPHKLQALLDWAADSPAQVVFLQKYHRAESVWQWAETSSGAKPAWPGQWFYTPRHRQFPGLPGVAADRRVLLMGGDLNCILAPADRVGIPQSSQHGEAWVAAGARGRSSCGSWWAEAQHHEAASQLGLPRDGHSARWARLKQGLARRAQQFLRVQRRAQRDLRQRREKAAAAARAHIVRQLMRVERHLGLLVKALTKGAVLASEGKLAANKLRASTAKGLAAAGQWVGAEPSASPPSLDPVDTEVAGPTAPWPRQDTGVGSVHLLPVQETVLSSGMGSRFGSERGGAAEMQASQSPRWLDTAARAPPRPSLDDRRAGREERQGEAQCRSRRGSTQSATQPAKGGPRRRRYDIPSSGSSSEVKEDLRVCRYGLLSPNTSLASSQGAPCDSPVAQSAGPREGRVPRVPKRQGPRVPKRQGPRVPKRQQPEQAGQLGDEGEQLGPLPLRPPAAIYSPAKFMAVTLNVQGLAQPHKLQALLDWAADSPAQVVFLQKCHRAESVWQWAESSSGAKPAWPGQWFYTPRQRQFPGLPGVAADRRVLLMGGDLNCILAPADRVGIPQSSQHGEAWVGSRGQGAEQQRQLVGERGLVDPWRHLHPSKRDLTHFSERWQTGHLGLLVKALTKGAVLASEGKLAANKLRASTAKGLAAAGQWVGAEPSASPPSLDPVDAEVCRYGLLSPNTSLASSQGAPCDSPVAESAGPREGRVPRVPKRQGPRVPKRQGPRVPKRQQPEQAGQLGDEGEQLGPLPLRPPAAIYSRALRPIHPPPHTRSPREDEPGLAMQRPRVAAKFMAVTLNVQGLAQPHKLQALLDWAADSPAQVVFLQKCHRAESVWQWAESSSGAKPAWPGQWFYTPRQRQFPGLPGVAADRRLLLMGGNLNCILAPADRVGIPQSSQHGEAWVGSRGQGAEQLRQLVGERGLVDPWRHLHPSKRDLTHFSERWQTGARLDRWYISEELVQWEMDSAIQGLPTDHRPVSEAAEAQHHEAASQLGLPRDGHSARWARLKQGLARRAQQFLRVQRRAQRDLRQRREKAAAAARAHLVRQLMRVEREGEAEFPPQASPRCPGHLGLLVKALTKGAVLASEGKLAANKLRASTAKGLAAAGQWVGAEPSASPPSLDPVDAEVVGPTAPWPRQDTGVGSVHLLSVQETVSSSGIGSRFGSERGGAAEMQASQSPRWLDTAARAPPRPSLDDRRAGREERQGEAQCRSRRGSTQSATQPAKGGPRRRRYDIPSSGSISEVKEDLRVCRYGLLNPTTSLANSQGAPCDSPVAESAGPREGRVPRVPKRQGPRVPKRQGPRVPKRQQPEQAGQLGDEGEQLGPLPLRPRSAIYSQLSPNDKWNDEKSTADVKSEEALNVAYHGLSKLSVTQPHALCPTMQAGEAGRAQPAHRMPAAHAPAIHDWPAVTQPHALCPTMQAGEAGRAQPAYRMPAAHAPAIHDWPAVTQPHALCPTMQAGEAGGAQPAHRMPEAHAPAIHDWPAVTQPHALCPTMQAGEAGRAQPAHRMPAAHAPAIHDWPAVTQPHALCPTMQAGEAGRAQPAHRMPAAHAPATHDTPAMTQPRVQCPTMQAGKSSVIAHHYNTTLQRHTIYRITILDKQRRPTNAITMDHLKTAIEWLGTLSTSYCAMAITYIAWLLLACGDVEANPGPNTHYVQQEGSSTCQADSLNNLAGRKWVSIDDIDTFYAQRLTQLNTPDELIAWQMARGAGGYDDGVIDLYLTSKYGLISTSVADLRRPQDWTKHNLDSLAQRHETTAFLCKRLGHSMAMTSLNGKWSLKDSLEPAPTPLARIALPTKQTHHQLFIITPTHTTRTSAQIALCHTKKINHIISHTNHNTSPPVPIYMEAQHKCFCLVHAINMAMGRPLINPHDVLTHCSHLATHLQDLASRARGENRHIPLPDRTPHIYDEDGNFNIHSMNHYLYHNYKTLHLATQELPQDNITRATLSTLMGKEDNHTSNAAILINRNHATTLRYLDNTWYWLDSQATQARRLLTTADWKELQGRLILIKQGTQHKNLIEPIFWLADPMEQATTTQLEHHYARPHHIDLSGRPTSDDQPPTIPPPAATPHPLTTSNNAPKRKNTYAEADPPARSRHREDANAKEDAATPPPPTRNEKPSTKTGPKKPRSKKGAKNTSHSKDRHTQTLMSRYLTNTQAAPTATIPSPPVPCPTTKAPPILPTQPHQTPSRQYLTLTTLNVRGLYRARRDVSHLIHHHHPDILILTETKTHHKKDTPGWLKVTTQDYTLHRHGGHSEVLIGIKHDLAIQMQATLVPPSTEAEINSRCVILTLSQHHSENLTIVATYWPSGCNEDALPLRENMQHHIRTATGHLPGSLILAGDLNATMKTEDRSEHTEYTQDRMMREFASEMRLSEADPGDRAWTYQQPHCNSRIDAILTRDARPGPEHRTIVDTHAYLSDHRPLIATLTTARMGIHLAQTQQAQSHKHTVLTTPITNSDREAFRLAVQQPSSGAPQLHARLAAYLSPLFTEATDFLANLDKANPHQPKRLTELAGLHPRQAVDMAATMLTTLLETCRTTAMKTCTTKTLTRGGQHYQRRT
ncbi:hypothetical protein QJQ45_007348, partial [Haematococcus lacustris]